MTPDRAITPGQSQLGAAPFFVEKLSDRERAALRLAAQGHTAREIGSQLHIEARTVKMHLQMAREKLCARNTIQAVVLAIRYGFISIDTCLAH